MKKLLSIFILSVITLACTFGLVACDGIGLPSISGGQCKHVFTNYVSDNNATCESDGTKTAICDKGCGTKDVKTIPNTKLGHKYTNYVNDNNATCESDGTKTAICDNGCGTKDVKTIPNTKLGHKYTNYVSDNNATYEEDGTKTATCDNDCGKTHTVTDEGSKLQKIITYTVTFEGFSEPVIVEEGKLVTAPSSQPTKNGYKFDGWDFDFNTKINQDTVINGKWIAIFTTDGGKIIGLTEYGKTLTEIVIPESIDGLEITTIGDFAFYGFSSLTNISIPNSVTSIGLGAFYGCESLQYNVEGDLKYLGNEGNKYLYLAGTTSIDITTVTINSNCKFIGDEAFYYCDSLTSVTIPNSVTSIGVATFYNCYSLTSIVLPNSVTSIGSSAFYGCESLQCNVEGNLKYLGSEENKYLYLVGIASEDITTAIINSNCKFIGDEAFYYCSSLASVTIPNSVTSIGEYAFSNCSSLTSITIPDSVTSICSGAFNGCTSFTSIEIPNSVTKIADWAFAYCTSLTNIEIPNSVTSIGSNAFYNCSSFVSITIPDSVISLGDETFAYCHSLTSITIGDGVTSIGIGTFYYCGSLASVTIGDDVTSIGNYAFSDCTSLTSITIPDSVTSIGEYAFGGCSFLTSVTIGNGVTSIGYSAFRDCSNLTSITIPNSVTSIDDWAFDYCTSLTSIVLPNSVTSIGDYAFYGCSNLTIYCEAEAKPIGWDADWNFYDCPVVWGYNFTEPEEPEVPEEPETPTTPAIFTVEGNTITGLTEYGKTLTEIVIPESIDGVEINAIGDSAFVDCILFTSVTIGDSVTSIGYGAFTRCSYLSNVTIGKNVKNIGITAFALCNSLNEIVIPSSVTTLEGAFYGCEGLSSIIVEQGNQNFTVIDGNLYTKDGKTLIQYALKSTNSEFEIPNGVTGIGIGAFAYCKTLNKIIIPNSVTNIARESFYNANNLQYNVEGELNYLGNEQNKYLYLAGTTSKNINTVVINSNCKFIGFEAFVACSSLTDVTIPNSVTSIDAGAFSNCRLLTSVTIGDGVTSIGDYAFRFCNSLTSVTIGNSVTSIGDRAFYGCSKLTSITVDENNQNYKSIDGNLYTKDGKTLLQYATGKTATDFVIPNSVTSIGDWAFYGCNSLTSVTIPNSVTSIGSYAFSYCSSLTSVTIGNSVTSIGDDAFYYCSSLTSVTIGDSVTSIGDDAFYGCSKLTSITVDENNQNYKSIDGNLYTKDGKTLIQYTIGKTATDFVIPNSVTSIGDYAFAWCNSLTSVTIPNSVTSIGEYAFACCSSLTSVTIGDGVTSIGEYAFYDCDSLTSVTIGDGVTSIGSYAFYDCTSLTSITIPDSVTSIGSSAFIGCSSLVSVTIGKNVEFIAGNVFRNCDSLTEIIIDSDNESYILVENSLYSKDGKVLLKHFADENETEIIVPDGVEIIGEYAFENLKSITSVTLPNTLTTLGAGAFYGCSSLINVNLPDGITKIEDYTFYQCVSLEEIVLTDNVISIGRNAFYYCNALTTITIPNSVIVIDSFAFSGLEKNLIIYCEAESQPIGWNNLWNSSKQNVVWDCKNNNVAIDGYEHLYVDELHVVIKDGTATILGSKATLRIETHGGVNHLDYSYNITEANIPKTVNSNGNSYNVTAISANAFKDCKSLTSVTIPSSIITIGNSAFRGCYSLTIYCEAESMPSGWDSYWNYSNCPVVWGYNSTEPEEPEVPETPTTPAIFTVEGNTITGLTEYGKTLTEIVIPESIDGVKITTIDSFAFYYCDSFTSITIPNSVTRIGSYAFYNCNSLTSITVDENNQNYKSIDGNLYTKDGKTLVQYAIAKTANEFIISNSVTSIGSHAFSYCSSLTSITIPNSVTSIGSGAFYGCSSLEKITIPFVGSNSDGTGNTYFGYIFGVTDHNYNDDYIPQTLKTVVITGGKSIDEDAFHSCDSLTSVTIGDSVTSIGDYAFAWCNSLTSVTIGNSVTSISEYAFYVCSKLTSITVDENNPNYKSIDGNLYTKDGKTLIQYALGITVTEFVIPNNVTSIGEKAFYGYSLLANITVDENNPNYKSIDGNLYTKDGKTLLQYATGKTATDFVIPNSVTSIGDYAFAYSRSLRNVIIGNNVTSMGYAVFNSCGSELIVYCEAESKPNGWDPFWSSSSSCDVVWGYNSTEPEEPEVPEEPETPTTPAIFTVEGNSITGLTEYGKTLTEIVIPESIDGVEITAIEINAFYEEVMTYIFIPSTITEIRYVSICNCYNLSCIEVDENNQYFKSIDGNLYNKEGTRLIQYAIGKTDTNFELPSSVVSIADEAFCSAKNLTNIVLHDKLSDIGMFAFANCTSITSIILPLNVRTIYQDIFVGCENLTIYCEAESMPSGWMDNWNDYGCPVVWGYVKDNPGTNVGGDIILPPLDL